MNLQVKPASFLKGSIVLPASKSYSIRAFIISACGGTSKIIDASDSQDAMVALRLARALGAKARRRGDTWVVQSHLKRVSRARFDVGESGTSLRFLLPLLPFHAAQATVVGRGTLSGRPNHQLCGALRRQGMDIRGRGQAESVPIKYAGGDLRGGVIRIEGNLSSQFISALLIAAPRLAEHSRIIIDGNMVSAEYVTMTRQILSLAGIKTRQHGPREIRVFGGQTFCGLRQFLVPSDYGLAAFPLAAGVLAPSRIRLRGHFNDVLIQSDGHILPFLKRLGVRFKHTQTHISIEGPQVLKGGVYSLKTCPDLVPIMAVLALFAQGPTTLKDIAHARVKESDRISDLRKELTKVGARIRESSGQLVIQPTNRLRPGQTLDPHHDHRLAMAFTVLGLRIGCRVLNMECTAKSYPAFVSDMKTLGVQFD